MKDIWNIESNWSLDNNTWVKIEQLDTNWSGVTYIPDNYFKYQKCLSGISYQYVNVLDDIYTKNEMVGKSWCIYNMYNEFDIINNFMINMDTVDVCSTINLDLSQRYYTIDNVNLKTKHKVLLVNQTNNIENGLYNIDQRGYLISSNYLADSGNTYRYKAYTKLGDNKHKEFHLLNSGNVFPILNEPSIYITGKTYIIKNFFNYNLESESAKLIFTDYDIARHTQSSNYLFYSGFSFLYNFSDTENIIIKYHDNNYIVAIDPDINKFIYTDTIISGTTVDSLTLGTTIINLYDTFWLTNANAVYTFVKVSADFYNAVNLNDYINFEISGVTNLSYKTFIQSKYNPSDYYVSLKNIIPNNIITDLNNATYTITNLQWSLSGTSDIQTTLNASYFSKYFDIDSMLNISPKYYKYNHYFDYDGLEFIYSGSTTYIITGFTTNNHYVKYKLYEHLNYINSTIFNNSYSFLNSINITGFTTGFTVLNPAVQSSEYYDQYPKGTYIKIIPENSSDMNFFKKNTFVNLNGLYKTLIVDYQPNEYFIIETYKQDSGLTITSIENIYTLTGISEMLYYIYINEENDWYRKKDDSLRKSICVAYSRIIENDINITKYTTALLTQDNKHKFILEMYNPENLYNNGGNVTLSYDSNLTYKPIELIEIGVDKHTKIPIPILNENLLISYDTIIIVTGDTTGITSTNKFTFYIKATIGMNFNCIFYSTNSTSLNINWGDGTIEDINFNTYHLIGHTYLDNEFFTITFIGDLQYITSLTADGAIINTDIITIKNLSSLTLANNLLLDLNINNLMYLTYLNLENNSLLDVDKYYNSLSSNGLLSGYINTSGNNNSVVTSLSNASRSNLISYGWNLIYNI
jgi:hypothetical protein